MAQLPGLFDSFDNLDQIDINSLITWIKNPPDPIHLENYLANRILYPQTISLTEADMQIDMAILREALRLNGPKEGKENEMLGDNSFLNKTLRKIIIPQTFLPFAPDLKSLAWAFVDGLFLEKDKNNLEETWTVIVSDDTEDVVGTIMIPKFGNTNGFMELNVEQKKYKVKSGSLTVIPCKKERCEISYKFSEGKILGKIENALEVYGGELGIMIDGRLK